MTNITVLFLVLTLTGVPAASVVCVTECQNEPATSGHCHDDMATSEGPMMSASDSCNDRAISDSAYVIEHRAMADASVLTATSLPAALEVVRTDAPALSGRTPDEWLKPLLVLRI